MFDLEDIVSQFTKAIDERLKPLENLAAPRVGRSRADDLDPEQTALFTKRITKWRVIATALAGVAATASAGAYGLWQALDRYAMERAEEVIAQRETAEAAKAVAEQVSDTTRRVEALERRPAPDTSELERKIEDLQTMNAVQWAYMTEVIEALRTGRRLPSKPKIADP